MKGNTVNYYYDKANRLIKTESPFNGSIKSVSQLYYDGNGNVIKKKQSNNTDVFPTLSWAVTEYAYDSMNNNTDIAIQVDALNKIYTHNSYNTDSSLSSVISGLTQPYSPLSGSDTYSAVSYSYDLRGNCVSITDALGQEEHSIPMICSAMFSPSWLVTENTLSIPTMRSERSPQKRYMKA